jgi:hypothetical protein
MSDDCRSDGRTLLYGRLVSLTYSSLRPILPAAVTPERVTIASRDSLVLPPVNHGLCPCRTLSHPLFLEFFGSISRRHELATDVVTYLDYG